MDVQFQIRQNAMEMQGYMKDLFDWQKSIKKKERALASSATAGGANSSAAPGPRGRASGAVAPAPAALMQPALGPKGPAATSKPASAPKPSQSAPSGATARTAAAHTYTSYGKWDKFDVDAALASDDDDDQSATAPSRDARRTAPAAAAAPVSGPKPSGSGGPQGDSAAASDSGGGTGRVAIPASADASASVSAPISRNGGITISATDPGVSPSEDLMKPLSTTRLAKPTAAAPATPAADGNAAPAPAATLPPIRNSQPTTADAWRARGNDLFKAGEYDSAYECYSRSVEMQPTCLGHANRAMALLKLGRWKEAVEDCTRALDLDPSYIKAYQRRAAAHRQLGSSLEAARDWEAALRLEPENRATAADRDASLELLLTEQKLQPPSRRTVVPVQWELPPRQPNQAPPQPPAPQVQLQQQPAGTPATVATHGIGSPEIVQEVTSASKAEVQPTRAGAGSSSHVRSAAATAITIATGRGGNSALPPEAEGPLPPQQQQPPQQASSSTAAATAAAAAAAAAATAAAAAAAAAKSVPRTSVEFEAAWRGMAGDAGRQAAYLSAIPPSSLPTIFKSSLTAPVLASLLRCLLTGMAHAAAPQAPGAAAAASASEGSVALPPEVGVALLEGLTKVPRFDMMAMSVPNKERQELRAAWEGLGEKLGGEGVAAALAALRPKYRL